MNVRSAQLNGVAQDLVHKADDRGVLLRGVEVSILIRMFVHHFERGFAQCAQGVGAHPQALLHFALDGLAGCQHRLEVEAGQRFERIQSLGGEKPAGGHFNGAVDAFERKQFLFEQNPGGKQ